MEEILIREVNDIFSCDVSIETRERKNVDGRVAISYFLRQNSKNSFAKIGGLFNKHYATVMHYVKSHDNLYKFNTNYKTKYDQMSTRYKSLMCRTCVYPLNLN
ncbi:MAG: hypothetical protein V4666_08300 [Bacteroidota bacterium]